MLPWQIPDDDPNHTPLGAAFARENACSLALVNAETGAARVVVPLTAKPAPSSGRLSPSGKWIAYVGIFRPKGEKGIGVLQDLVVCDAKTGAVEFTDAGLEPDEDPKIPPFRWHPTEDRIVWVRGLRAYDVDFSRPAPPAPAVSGATAKTPGAAAPREARAAAARARARRRGRAIVGIHARRRNVGVRDPDAW